jgi:hypothetical protein
MSEVNNWDCETQIIVLGTWGTIWRRPWGHWQPCDLRGSDVSVLRAPGASHQSGHRLRELLPFEQWQLSMAFPKQFKNCWGRNSNSFPLKVFILVPQCRLRRPQTSPLRPSFLVLVSLYLGIHSNSVENAVITKLLIAYLVRVNVMIKWGIWWYSLRMWKEKLASVLDILTL